MPGTEQKMPILPTFRGASAALLQGCNSSPAPLIKRRRWGGEAVSASDRGGRIRLPPKKTAPGVSADTVSGNGRCPMPSARYLLLALGLACHLAFFSANAHAEEGGEGIPTQESWGDDETASADEPREKWTPKPYFRPILGFSSVVTSSSVYTGAQLGATAGLTYWRAPLMGRTRVLAAYYIGTSKVSGAELRLGTFMGPHFKLAGAEAGIDVFWDRFLQDGDELLAPSVGIDFPVNVQLGPEVIYVMAGVCTAIMFNEERRVDWDDRDAFGFGHEFGWQLGLGAKLGKVRAAAVYSQRQVVAGTRRGLGVSLSF